MMLLLIAYICPNIFSNIPEKISCGCDDGFYSKLYNRVNQIFVVGDIP